MKLERKKIVGLIVPDKSGRSLKGLFGVIESWNKNRNDSVIERIAEANTRDLLWPFILVTVLLLIIGGWFGALAVFAIKRQDPGFDFLVGGFTSILTSGCILFCYVIKGKKTPTDLQDFERLLNILTATTNSNPFETLEDNSPWYSMASILKSAENHARWLMQELENAETNLMEFADDNTSKVETVRSLGIEVAELRAQIFGEMALMASAGLISRDRGKYTPVHEAPKF